MGIISVVLLALLPVLLAQQAQAFFWSCPSLLSDPTASNITQLRAVMSTMFPASVYLKKGRSGETDYSCITITTFDKPQKTPNLYPAKRWLLGLDCLLGLCPSLDPLRPQTPSTYNVTITYYLSTLFITSYGNFSLVEKENGLYVKLSGLPINLFGESSGKAELRIASVGDGYCVLIDCTTYVLSLANEKHAYMLTSPKMNKTDLQKMDWRCMSSGLEELTSTSNILPGGICTASGMM